MAWIKLNHYVDYWDSPVLGSEDSNDSLKFMALCIDPSSKNPYIGIARQITERQGNPDIPGYVDKSRLVLVESHDLLNFKILGELNICNINESIEVLEKVEHFFIGLEDPDILIDDKNIKHIYFTIPFKYKHKEGCEIFIGHAHGNELDKLKAENHVLSKVSNEIAGFKEICPLPLNADGKLNVLVETFVDRGENRQFSAVGLIEFKDYHKNWEFVKLIHDPEKEKRDWCSWHSSTCRFFDPNFLTYRGYLVGLMNGREKTQEINGQKIYGKFRPGLFLFDTSSKEIVWIDDEPLLEDPLATTITFASELVYLNDNEAILYAHPNDSFI